MNKRWRYHSTIVPGTTLHNVAAWANFAEHDVDIVAVSAHAQGCTVLYREPLPEIEETNEHQLDLISELRRAPICTCGVEQRFEREARENPGGFFVHAETCAAFKHRCEACGSFNVARFIEPPNAFHADDRAYMRCGTCEHRWTP